MTQTNYTVITNYGQEWNARAAAGEDVSPITRMVFGDGDRSPTGGETSLLNQVHSETLSDQGVLEDQSAAFFDAYLQADIGGFIIREHGLITADGKLVAIGVRSPGIPKADPATGAADDFTYRIDIFFDRLDALVVEIDPLHGLTAERRVDTSDGLKGGGPLSSDLILSLDRTRLLRPAKQKFVLISDLQPSANAANGPEQVALVNALIESVIDNHSEAVGVIFPGDITHRGQPTSAQIASYTVPYVSMRDMRAKLARLPGGLDWLFALTGNHDVSYVAKEDDPEGRTFIEFLRRFPASRYHIKMGNMVVIFLGDEDADTAGGISDLTVDWWEDIVLAHQDDFIVTASHQSLMATVSPDSTWVAGQIKNSERFIERMTRAENPAKVHLWLNGHHGHNSVQNFGHRTAVAHGGCRFVQVGAHVPSILGENPKMPAVYWTMNLEDGSDKIALKQWNHSINAYVDENEIEVTSPSPLRLSSVLQFDGRHQTHQRFDPQAQIMLARASKLTIHDTEHELRLRMLEGRPTANMETAL